MKPSQLSFNSAKRFFKNVTALFAVTFFFGWACTNDPAEVKLVTTADESPAEYQEHIRLVYSDSGMVKMVLEAPVAENYGQKENPRLVFPKGIYVRFYDATGEEESSITSNYAVRFINEQKWQARGDVVVENNQNERLNTEELFWDEANEKIYSDVFVKMTTEKQIIMGEGFESDQNFTNAVVKKVTGQIEMEDEE